MTSHHPTPTHWRRTGIALLLLATACTDDPTAPPDPARAARAAMPSGSPEQVALTELTRAVALALRDEGLRTRVKNDMRDSKVREHKLEFRSYLNGQSGGILLAKLAKETGKSREEVLALVRQVRPLEFYMPVAEHRRTWLGDANLLVVSGLEDEDEPVGFDLDGQQVALSREEAPGVPTLTLVPVETDFSRALNVGLAGDGGETTAATGRPSLLIEDGGGDGGGGGGGGGGGTAQDGMYLTYAHVYDLHEPWFRGNPELETHVHGPRDAQNPKWGEDLTCAGEHAYEAARYYDQNGHLFGADIGAGAPLLMSRYQINQFQARFPNEAYHILVWEDDDTACVIKTDMNIPKMLEEAATAAGAAGAGILAKGGGWHGAVGAAVSAFVISILRNGATLLKTNDDFVGNLVDTKGTQYEITGRTHRLMKGGTHAGWADVKFVWPTSSNGRSFAASVSASPQTVSIDQTGSAQLSATVLNQYGQTVSGHPIAWRSAYGWVASVDANGLVRGAGPGNTTVYVRSCDPSCTDVPVQVSVTGPTVSGPTWGRDEYFTLTAGVVNPRQDPYFYEWTYRQCTSGGWCDYMSYPVASGWNLTSVDGYISRYDYWVEYTLTLRTAPGGGLVGSAVHTVSGPGESDCADPSQIYCDNGGAMQSVTRGGTAAGTKAVGKPGAAPAKSPSPRSGSKEPRQAARP